MRMAGPWVSIMMPMKLFASGGGGADVLDHAPDPIVRRVGHVEAENVHAGLDQLGEHFGRIRGGAEGGDDFGVAHNIEVNSSRCIKGECKAR